MSDWLSYGLADFVPFSAEVYWRLIERYNAELWPMHLLSLALGAGVIWLLFRPRPWSARVIALVLALAWAWIGWRFIGGVYAQVHVVADGIVWAFWAQAGLLLILGLPAGLEARMGDVVDRAIAVASIALYPVLPFMTGRPMTQAEIFGISPDPTALATLGLAAVAAYGLRAVVLMVIPLGWTLFSGLTLVTLGAPEGWVLLAGAGLALGGLLVRRPSRARHPQRH